MVKVEDLDSDFRNSIDLFFFSNRLDIDLNQYKNLIIKSDIHKAYLIECFFMSLDVFWKNGNELWNYRLKSLLGLNVKKISSVVSSTLENNMHEILNTKKIIHPFYNPNYLQFIELCKVKSERGDNLNKLKDFFINLPHTVSTVKLIKVVNNFTPFLFKDLKDFSNFITSKIKVSDAFIYLLKELEKHEIFCDKDNLVEICVSLLNAPVKTYGSSLSIYALLNEKYVIDELKKIYDSNIRDNLLEFVDSCADRHDLEANHLRNVRNILELDSSLVDEIAKIYSDKIDIWGHNSGKFEADKLINFIQKFPQVNVKKLILHLSSKRKSGAIKYIIKKFPELNKLGMLI